MSMRRSKRRGRDAAKAKERRVAARELGADVILNTLSAHAGEPVLGAVVFVLGRRHIERLSFAASVDDSPAVQAFARILDTLTAEKLRELAKGKRQ
jgi:hypothetical protein